jgi:hypothetical protein
MDTIPREIQWVFQTSMVTLLLNLFSLTTKDSWSPTNGLSSPETHAFVPWTQGFSYAIKDRILRLLYWERLQSFKSSSFWLSALGIVAICTFTLLIFAPQVSPLYVAVIAILAFVMVRAIAYLFISNRVVQRYSNLKIYEYIVAICIEFSIFDMVETNVRPKDRRKVRSHLAICWALTTFILSAITVAVGLMLSQDPIGFYQAQCLTHVLPFALGIAATHFTVSAQDDLENIRNSMNLWIVSFIVVLWLFQKELENYKLVLFGVSATLTVICGTPCIHLIWGVLKNALLKS